MNRTYVAKPKNTVEGDGKGGKVVPTKVIPNEERKPDKADPGSVVDHIGKYGKVETRRFFDSNGRIRKDITTHDHGKLKNTPSANMENMRTTMCGEKMVNFWHVLRES